MADDTGSRKLTRREVLRNGIRSASAIAVLPVLAGCTLLDALEDDRYVVVISTGARFEPSGLTIPVGASVVWRNQDENVHRVTTDPELLDEPARVSVPEGAEPFASDDIMTGEQYRHTFTVPGTYVYTSQYFQDFGAIGTITVE